MKVKVTNIISSIFIQYKYIYDIICTYIKGVMMLELGISQAQAQFTQILNQTVLIVDKKAHNKKAVILPYDEYNSLLLRAAKNTQDLDVGVFSQFVGVLDDDFATNDSRYNKILK